MKNTNKILKYCISPILCILCALFLAHETGFADWADWFGAGGATLGVLFTGLEFPEDECSVAGLQNNCYIVKTSDIESMPTITINDADPKSKITYIGNIVLKAGKYFTPIYITDEKNSLKEAPDGQPDNMGFKITFKGFHPSTRPDALGMAALLNNSNTLILVRDFINSGFRVIGHTTLPAKLKCETDSGEAHNSAHGVTLTCDWYSCTPAKIYNGIVPLAVDEIIS